MPDLKDNHDLVDLIEKKKVGIQQGNLNDCYLISSILIIILSIIFTSLLVVNYIFPKNEEYSGFSDIIRMLVFENGIRNEIYSNNTYPLNEYNEYIFEKQLDNSFFNNCIERGYATYCSNKKRHANKPEKLSIKSGYENIRGGFQYEVFSFLFGCINEHYDFFKINNIQDKEKKISKENLLKK